MKSIEQMVNEYADLVITSGVCLYHGQSLQIKAGPEAYWFAQILAEKAYEKGALLVRIEIEDLRLIKKRTDVQNQDMLADVPDFSRQTDYEMMVKDWAYIRIDNTEDRHYLTDADADQLAIYKSALSIAGTLYRNSRMRHEHPWCVIAVPGPRWAKDVLGEQAETDDLWKVVAPILKLDTPNPAKAWQDHADLLLKRGQKLNDLAITSLHFKSAKTDFTVGFTKEHLWAGGGDPLPNGTWFLPNIPTEEVFTTPDRLTASGYIATTKPVSVMDSLVEDVVLTFEKGKVVACKARIGQSVMDKFLAMDEGASYLGEVALVDEDSPIAQSGKVFGSILYDENASCHIALGAGYPSCLKNAEKLSNETLLREAGCNTSMVHTDFMVGSSDMDIIATTARGKQVQIMKAGRFTL